MALVYVLNETEKDGSSSTVGVFDYSDVGREKLEWHYGPHYEEISHMDIEDSGLEWQKRIVCDEDEIVLTLHYFTVNEI